MKLFRREQGSFHQYPARPHRVKRPQRGVHFSDDTSSFVSSAGEDGELTIVLNLALLAFPRFLLVYRKRALSCTKGPQGGAERQGGDVGEMLRRARLSCPSETSHPRFRPLSFSSLWSTAVPPSCTQTSRSLVTFLTEENPRLFLLPIPTCL